MSKGEQKKNHNKIILKGISQRDENSFMMNFVSCNMTSNSLTESKYSNSPTFIAMVIVNK
ncbi:CLUMA_CG007088, isoform A [Clunio marinus]|uniref:CLUMA_CG007088, isoform A n=1 Tax=Clunio marinus TaxID=568069 RepID=A0A1J1I017_9DIPT|nr:CLUMA_CG007088, isoform A [Clunio marinus]